MALAIGDRLGRYEIIAPIRAGGMGEVWKAQDTQLHRIVAVKLLKPEYSAWLAREAKAIAALNHPHICQIYDIGPDYLVLEYVEGTPIRGPLKLQEAVRLGIQIAEALEEAHARGVLHRDLKPDNILVTSKGVTKLLDFGLAKVVNKADSDSTSSLEGKLIGTPAYLSPEQALGKSVDERSDMFSFGAVLYEMLSGNRAFRGNSSAEVLSAVLHDDPIPVSAPLDVERIVMRCLRRAPTEKYENISEVRSVLTQVSMDLAAKHPSIAVLPFDNMSASKDDEYFGDGLAEEILNLLTHIPGLKSPPGRRLSHSAGRSKTTQRSAKRSAFARSSPAASGGSTATFASSRG